MLTLRYMPNTSSVLHLHPTLVPLLFVQSLYSPFLIPRIFYLLVSYGNRVHVTEYNGSCKKQTQKRGFLNIYFHNKGIDMKHREYFEDFHKQYVLVPADKAANNVIVVCKKLLGCCSIRITGK